LTAAGIGVRIAAARNLSRKFARGRAVSRS
jgi:hypothetical protein